MIDLKVSRVMELCKPFIVNIEMNLHFIFSLVVFFIFDHTLMRYSSSILTNAQTHTHTKSKLEST
jgi:hypothetical protein